MKKIALVTGANKGLGFETSRELAQKGYTVILTARDPSKGKEAAEKLRAEKLDVHFHVLDVSKDDSVEQAKSYVQKEFGRCDVLINNAGILNGTESVFKTPVDDLREEMETNAYGVYRMMRAFVPMMIKNGYGRVVNVSSGMGQLDEMNGGYPGYRVSKTAINAMTRIFADEAGGHNVLINSICPGWVKTDMGGASAERSIPEGVDTIVWAATLPDGAPTGSFFRDREKIPW